jgi:hypothetical protein
MAKKIIIYNLDGTPLEIQDEGVTINNSTGKINFIGTGVMAQQDGSIVNQVDVYIPSITYAPFFNTSTCLISDFTTYNRYVSKPNGHFDIGDWTPDTVHSCLRTNLTYSTPTPCSFRNTSTTFTVEVLNSINTVLTSNTITVTGNMTNTNNNITIDITDWSIDTNRYKANIGVNIDIESILTTGGRFSVRLTHTTPDGTFTKTQNDLFADIQTNDGTLSGVSITEGAVLTRYISGVKYYIIGSQFNMAIGDIDNINDESYPAIQLEVDSVEYGLTPLSLAGADLTGWNSDWNNTNCSYTKNTWSIDIPNYCNISTTGNIRARVKDWVDEPWVNSVDSNILVNTYSNTNTRLRDYFHYEDWRCPRSADFDLPNAKVGWNSSTNLGVGDAVVWNGGVGRDLRNWGIYNPAGNPNYSVMDSEVWYYREFNHNGNASSGFTLNVTGSYASFEYKLGKAWNNSSTGGSVWIKNTAYNLSQWNNADPIGGSGGQVGLSNHFSFGTNNIINCNNTIYVRFKFIGSQRITALSVVFD